MYCFFIQAMSETVFYGNGANSTIRANHSLEDNLALNFCVKPFLRVLWIRTVQALRQSVAVLACIRNISRY